MERSYFINYYEILRLQPSANNDEIKRAYRALAKRLHPDLNQDDPQASERFRHLQQAYEILRDPSQRLAFVQQRQSRAKSQASVPATPAAP